MEPIHVNLKVIEAPDIVVEITRLRATHVLVKIEDYEKDQAELERLRAAKEVDNDRS